MANNPALSDNWDEMLHSYFTTTISAKHRLIQSRIFHRAYYTPLQLFQMHRKDNPECHKCHNTQGDFWHMLWSCDKIRPFWSQVTQFIATNFDFPNICSPKWYILGVLEDIDMCTHQKEFLKYLLLYARKIVVLQWINSEIVPINLWKNLIK